MSTKTARRLVGWAVIVLILALVIWAAGATLAKGISNLTARTNLTRPAAVSNATTLAPVPTIEQRVSHLEALQRADAKNERRQWAYIRYIMRWIRKHRH